MLALRYQFINSTIELSEITACRRKQIIETVNFDLGNMLEVAND